MTRNFHYNKKLKKRARILRSESVSMAEKYLWKSTLSRRKTGERFLRQRPINNFIVDFFAPELSLIIEIDGNSHYFKGPQDFNRQKSLTALGYTIIRFSELEVIQNIEHVKQQIDFAMFCIQNNKQINSDYQYQSDTTS